MGNYARGCNLYECIIARDRVETVYSIGISRDEGRGDLKGP